MSFGEVEAVADAILYEGYMLYPYRRSALKNRAGWTFGVISPRASSSDLVMTGLGCECLLIGDESTQVSAKLRFLAPSEVDASPCEVTAASMRIGELGHPGAEVLFAFGNGGQGRLALSVSDVGGKARRLAIAVSNLTVGSAGGERSQSGAMVSTHVLVSLRDGEFVPPRDPPSSLAAAADSIRQSGLWPILVGKRGRRDLLLCSPIILDDYPEIAPESSGPLFDGTEIEEILALRILTLSDQEREEIARGDPRVRALIDRSRGLAPAELARLHGTKRVDPQLSVRPSTLKVGDRDLGPGDHVLLRPARRADIMDIALAGRRATVVSVERDFDGRSYFAVTVEGDPGQDLGALGQPGHRFFFGPDEVELIPA
jgi:hypothetical protein